MSLTALMIEQIGSARTIVEEDAEVIAVAHQPARGLLPRLHPVRSRQARAARACVAAHLPLHDVEDGDQLRAHGREWLGPQITRSGEEALLAIGVSLVQRITVRDPVTFGLPEWLMLDQVDETYFQLLPSGGQRDPGGRRTQWLCPAMGQKQTCVTSANEQFSW
jgi:hypothetical protein